MATKIVIDHLAGARLGSRVQLEPAPRVRFGRHPENEIAFDPHKDLDASTRHAELREEDGRYWLVDVGSSNGTFVAGQKIARYEVVVGAPVEVEFGQGGPKVRLFVGDPAQLAGVPETMVARLQAPVDPHAPTLAAGPPPATRGRTMAMMVQHARAEVHDKRGIARSTQFMRSMVDQALHTSTRRFRLVVLAMTGMFGLVIVGLVSWNLSLSRPRPLEPAQPVGEAGPRIVRENHDALFLVAAGAPGGPARGFCTGFAVARRHLATNAHCVDELNRLRAAGQEVFAVQNGDPALRMSVVGVVKHPDYRSGAARQTPDVALLELSGDTRAQVRLKDDARLADVVPGMTMYTYGFPGRLARPEHPEATLTQGTIGRVTTFAERVGPVGDNRLVQHSAFTMEGTSGSPVFDASGEVIAVNTGSYRRESPEVGGNVPVSEALSGYNVAVRVDVVVELMRGRGIEPARPARKSEAP